MQVTGVSLIISVVIIGVYILAAIVSIFSGIANRDLLPICFGITMFLGLFLAVMLDRRFVEREKIEKADRERIRNMVDWL